MKKGVVSILCALQGFTIVAANQEDDLCRDLRKILEDCAREECSEILLKPPVDKLTLHYCMQAISFGLGEETYCKEEYSNLKKCEDQATEKERMKFAHQNCAWKMRSLRCCENMFFPTAREPDSSICSGLNRIVMECITRSRKEFDRKHKK